MLVPTREEGNMAENDRKVPAEPSRDDGATVLRDDRPAGHIAPGSSVQDAEVVYCQCKGSRQDPWGQHKYYYQSPE